MYIFGSGTIWAKQTADTSGAGVTAAPVMVGTVQEVSVEISAETKNLYGQNQFPVDVARGQASVSGTIKTATFSAKAFNALYFGGSISAEGKRAVAATTGTQMNATVTITPPSGAFAGDLGCVYVSTGEPLEKVASNPRVGQYTVDESSGVYTFSAGDVNNQAYISYLHTTGEAIANPETLHVKNDLMGVVPKFMLILQQVRDGHNAVLTLYACVADSLKMTFTNDDFSVPELSFSCCADDAGNVADWSFT